MKAKFLSYDLTVDEYFVEPAFALANTKVGNVGMLRALYEALNKRFTVSPSEMRVFGGNSLSDVRVSLGLFRGNGLIEIDVEKLHIVLKSISGPSDVEIVKDCISLVQDAVIATLDVGFRWANVTINSRVKPDEASVDIGSHFQELYAPPRNQVADGEGPALTHHLGIVYQCESIEGKWDAVFYATRDRDQPNEMSVFTIIRLLDVSLFPQIEDQVGQIDVAFDSFLKWANIEISTASET